MEKLFVFDPDEKIKSILQNKTGSNACPYYEAVITEQLNGEFTFEFQTLSNHRDAQHLIRGNKIGLWDENNQFLLFDISKTEDDHGEEMMKIVICEHSVVVELNDDIVEDKRPSDVTADVALFGILSDTVLGGTRWNVGSVAALGTATPENIYFESPLSGVQKIITAYKTDYKPRIEVSGNTISNRFVDLGPRGSDTGRRFEYTKDLKQIKRSVDMMGVKTALVGRGKGEESGDGYGRRIDFSAVSWATGSGDPTDKPTGDIYVGDSEALSQFGLADGSGRKRHRLGQFEDPDETDPELLLTKTWNHLQTINTPRVSYEMTVVDLAELTGLDHLKVQLGDTVAVIDREFVPALTIKARVIEIKKVLGEPEKTEIKLGNFIPLLTDETLKIEEVERKLNDKSGIWDGAAGPITNGDFQDITPEAPANVTAVGIFKTIKVDWTLETDVSIGQYEVYASKVAAFTPDTTNGTNLVWRGYGGGYVHKANTNEQWYFKVRAINKKGTGGPFAAEATATTLTIAKEDITPAVITNDLIAANAAIDFGKISNVTITDAMISNVSAGKLKAGTVIASDITFTGKLEGATGTFSGALEAATGTFNGEVNINNSNGGSSRIVGDDITHFGYNGNIASMQSEGIFIRNSAFKTMMDVSGIVKFDRRFDEMTNPDAAVGAIRIESSTSSANAARGNLNLFAYSDGHTGYGNINFYPDDGHIHAYGDFNFENNALVAANGGSTNIDHIWHDDSANAWNLVSDGSYKQTGNTRLNVGSILVNGDDGNPSFFKSALYIDGTVTQRDLNSGYAIRNGFGSSSVSGKLRSYTAPGYNGTYDWGSEFGYDWGLDQWYFDKQVKMPGGNGLRLEGNQSAYASFHKDYGSKRIGYVGSPTDDRDNFFLYSDNGIIEFSGACYVNTVGGIARWQQSDYDYIYQQSDGTIRFYMGGSVKHSFNPNGTKSGGSIEVDGVNLGMSPIDSPQLLLEYIDFNIPLSEEGVKVIVDETYLKTVDHFAIFPNNGQVVEKGINYFVIKGSGTADVRIVGERIGYTGAFYDDIEAEGDVTSGSDRELVPTTTT